MAARGEFKSENRRYSYLISVPKTFFPLVNLRIEIKILFPTLKKGEGREHGKVTQDYWPRLQLLFSDELQIKMQYRLDSYFCVILRPRVRD